VLPKIPWLRNRELRSAAEEVLSEYGWDGSVPIDIDDLVEYHFHVEILPLPSLRAAHAMEGGLTRDMSTIVVDAELMEHYSNRYRFTLAHEIGHRILHGQFIQALEWDTPESWKQFVLGYDRDAYSRLEAQAYRFAGYLLVPSDPLQAACQQIEAYTLEHGFNLSTMGAEARPYIARQLTTKFEVSAEVIVKRLSEEDIP
jgi:hypothetical protein